MASASPQMTDRLQVNSYSRTQSSRTAVNVPRSSRILCLSHLVPILTAMH